MRDRVAIDVEDETLDFELDLETCTWTLVGAREATPEEAAFPLVTTARGERYELYSDGTLAEVPSS
jgi:hypothetical protein